MIIEFLNPSEHFEVTFFIKPDIRARTLGPEQAIPFFPHPESVGLDTGKFGQVADAINAQNVY